MMTMTTMEKKDMMTMMNESDDEQQPEESAGERARADARADL